MEINIEPTNRDDRLRDRAKIISFCRDNGYMFEETTDQIIITVPLFKPFSLTSVNDLELKDD